jgi:hypothetical protein
MADEDEGEAAYQQNYHAALQEVQRIQDALAPHCKTPEELHEAMRLALKRVVDPVGYEQEVSWIDQENAHLRAELARREGERQQRIRKLRNAYWNFDKLPHTREKALYQSALCSMLQKLYGAKP